MSDDKPSAVHRAHRAKTIRSVVTGVDGGAIAVGLVVPLFVFAPTLVFNVPEWVVIGGLVGSLFLGGFLAQSVAAADSRRGGIHGPAVGLATVVVIGLVVIADGLATSDTVSLEIRSIVGPEFVRVLVSIVLAVAIAGVGGLVGTPRNASE